MSSVTSWLVDIIVFYNFVVLFYFLALNFYYLFLLFLAADTLFYYKRLSRVQSYKEIDSVMTPGIAILAPAYNEELTIIDSVRSLLQVEYPELEIIVINDGSRDNTLPVLKEHYRLFPVDIAIDHTLPTRPVKQVYRSAEDSRLIVIDKENGGKADALNVGITYAESRLFCAIDADSIIERDALNRLMQFYMERETKLIALGGIVRIANGCVIENGQVVEARLPRKFLPAIQVMEYIRAFLCGRAGWSKMNNLLIVSGAFGLFERKAVIECGGYRVGTVGEDMELVVRLHRMMCDKKRRYRILFIPDPVCWTEAPEDLRTLARQRNRWQRGLIETLLRHWKMLFNPRYGAAGMVAMPYFFLFEVMGPVIELTGYMAVIISFAFGWINLTFLWLFLALAILVGVLLSLFSLLLEEFTVKRYERPADVIRLLLLAVLENFGYRQLHSWWRLKAIFDLMRKEKGWGGMQRKAFGKT